MHSLNCCPDYDKCLYPELGALEFVVDANNQQKVAAGDEHSEMLKLRYAVYDAKRCTFGGKEVRVSSKVAKHDWNLSWASDVQEA